MSEKSFRSLTLEISAALHKKQFFIILIFINFYFFIIIFIFSWLEIYRDRFSSPSAATRAKKNKQNNELAKLTRIISLRAKFEPRK
jgi:hypothetical protein